MYFRNAKILLFHEKRKEIWHFNIFFIAKVAQYQIKMLSLTCDYDITIIHELFYNVKGEPYYGKQKSTKTNHQPFL